MSSSLTSCSSCSPVCLVVPRQYSPEWLQAPGVWHPTNASSCDYPLLQLFRVPVLSNHRRPHYLAGFHADKQDATHPGWGLHFWNLLHMHSTSVLSSAMFCSGWHQAVELCCRKKPELLFIIYIWKMEKKNVIHISNFHLATERFSKFPLCCLFLISANFLAVLWSDVIMVLSHKCEDGSLTSYFCLSFPLQHEDCIIGFTEPLEKKKKVFCELITSPRQLQLVHEVCILWRSHQDLLFSFHESFSVLWQTRDWSIGFCCQ